MKVLIVDDEKSSRETIKRLAHFEQLGFGCVLEAVNGREAVEKITEHGPELVITDMNMPVMDGIELLTMIERMARPINVIVISGYSDYNYMKAAIRTKVVDYILKPIREQELSTCLRKAADELKSQSGTAEQEESIFDLYYKIYSDRSAVYNKNNSQASFKDLYKAGINTQTYMALLMVMPNFYEVRDEKFNGLSDLLFFKVERSIRKLLQMEYNLHMIKPDKDYHEMFIMIGASNGNLINQRSLTAALSAFCDSIFQDIGLDCKATGMDMTSGNADVNEVCKQLRKVYLNTNIYSKPDFYPYNGFFANDVGRYAISESSQEYDSYIRGCDKTNAMKFINGIFDTIINNRNITVNQLQFLSSEFIFAIHNILKSYACNLTSIMAENINRVMLLSYLGKVDETRECIESITSYGIDYIHALKNDASGNTWNEFIRYINMHYAEKIDLETLSRKFFLSREHISRLFKKEFGVNFIEYLSRVRLEKAVELLKDSSLKIRNISDLTGFSDEHYFSSVFKKRYGETPADFRKKL